MKAPAAWLELPVVAVVLMGGMLGVMWAQRPGDACTMSPEAQRRLVLSRPTDREHLDADLAAVDRAARRYMRASADAAAQQTRWLECEAKLIQSLAATHGLAPERIRGAPVDVQ